MSLLDDDFFLIYFFSFSCITADISTSPWYATPFQGTSVNGGTRSGEPRGRWRATCAVDTSRRRKRSHGASKAVRGWACRCRTSWPAHPTWPTIDKRACSRISRLLIAITRRVCRRRSGTSSCYPVQRQTWRAWLSLGWQNFRESRSTCLRGRLR